MGCARLQPRDLRSGDADSRRHLEVEVSEHRTHVEAAHHHYDARDSSSDDDCMPCHIVKVEATFVEEEPGIMEAEPSFSCIVEGGMMIEIVLPQNFLDAQITTIERGTALFCVPRKHIDFISKTAVVPEQNHGLVQIEEAGRMLEAEAPEMLSGEKRLLAVRVSSTFGEEPEESRQDIAAAIFGTGMADSDLLPTTNVAAQYDAISHGALALVPATGAGIVDGVVDITLDRQVSGSRVQSDLASEIIATTAVALGPLEDVADRIIFCLPNYSELSGRDSWTAFTYLLEAYSFYQLSRCTKLSVVIHEVRSRMHIRSLDLFSITD